jgi:hypothetical protein
MTGISPEFPETGAITENYFQLFFGPESLFQAGGHLTDPARGHADLGGHFRDGQIAQKPVIEHRHLFRAEVWSLGIN